jgi:hypothetical protein
VFRQLARAYANPNPPGGPEFPLPPAEVGISMPPEEPRREKFSELFLYHPIQLAGLLEAAWEARFRAQVRSGAAVSAITGLPDPLLNRIAIARPFETNGENGDRPSKKILSDHLIYAYMIENTRIYEIFRKVLQEYLHGERLEVPSPKGQRWLRNTEELFYRDTPSFFAFQLTSYVRPDIRASRRNAYYRMFGMDLTHGTEDGRPYPYEKPAAANREFVNTLEEFLREVWRGIINFTNTSGPNTTDDSAIANLAERLSDMLSVRRRNGNLSREEFFFVATMSWFHLTVEFDSPIVKDLKAEAAGASDRLQKIAERAGSPAHAKAGDFFALAEPMSRLLIALESGTFNSPTNVRALYATGSPLRNDIAEIITAWSSATGRDLKTVPVAASPARALPSVAPLAMPAVNNSAAPVPASRP